MTIREYRKNLMVVKNIDSDIIGEAYFILKNNIYGDDDERKISAEAEKILKECSGRAKKSRRRITAALIGFFMGAGICAFIALIAFICVQFSM